MTSLIELAERVEAATGPDRELDALIEVELRRLAAYAAGLNDSNRAQWRASATGGVHDPHTVYTAPRYTASIDAAMSLVPWDWLKEREYRFGLEQDDWRIAPVIWCARFDQMCDGGDTILAVAAAPELALCAAALRARASL